MADNARTPEMTPAKFAAMAAHADSIRTLCALGCEHPYGDDVGDHISDLDTRLLNAPAPDRAALLWKLEQLLEVDKPDGFTSGWSAKHVAQTVADARRILGGA